MACSGLAQPERELMKIQDILSIKGSTVHSISPDATLQEVVSTLVERRIGALVVCQQGAGGEVSLLGIITERDILHACLPEKGTLAEVRAGDVMSRPLITGVPDDEVEQVMGLMTTRRIRHLPVLADGRLAGMISIGDVVKAQHDSLALENRFMKDYISNPR
jgi:CBS domain-containing protein